MRCFLAGLLVSIVGAFYCPAVSAQTSPVVPVDPSLSVSVLPSGGGSAAATATIPPILFGIVGGGSVELGQKVTLQVSFSGSGADQIYQWRKDGVDLPGANAVAYVITAATAADAGTYSVAVSNAAGGGVASTDLTVKPLAAPAVTTQPSNRTAQVGQPVTFSLSVTGSYPRTYQWRKDGNTLSGATNATYTIGAVVTADAGVYSVVITNSQGTVTSDGASLTVNAATPPVISTSTPYDSTYAQGQQATLVVYLSGGSSPFTYQWSKSGTPIPGATGSQLVFNSVALTDTGSYSVVVTNAAGTATSREATLTVTLAVAPVIGSSPQSQTIAEGQSASFSIYLSSGTSPVTYQWLKNGAAIAGATSNSYSVSSATLADAGNYSVVVTNVAGSATSAAAVLTVNPAVAPSITVQPLSQTVKYYEAINLSVQIAGSSPFTYQWKKDGVPLTNGTSSSFSLSYTTPANSGTYTVVVTNAAGSVTSAGAVITVNSAIAPTITVSPVNQTVNYYNGVNLSVQVSGSGPLSYQWQKDGVPLAAGNSSSYYISSATPANNGTYTVVVTNTAGSATSAGAVVTVNPAVPPAISTQPLSQTLSYYDTIYLSVQTSGSSPLTYQWKKDGVSLPNATSGYLYLYNVTPASSGSYTVVVTNPAGSVTSTAAVVTVNPAIAPVIVTQPTDRTVNYYESLYLSVQASGSNPLTYQWKKDGVAVTSGASNSYSVSNATPANNGTYTVVVTNAAGSVTSAGAVVTVNAAVAPTITVQPVGQTLNYFSTINLSVQVTGSGPLSYQWKKDGVALASGSSSYYYFSSATPANSGTYTVVVTNSAGSVTSAGAVVTVNAAVAPAITTPPASRTVNYYDSFSLSVQASGSSPLSYQWKKNGSTIPNATDSSLYINYATSVDSGTYTVVVTNSAGSVTSAGAVVTVNAAVAPTITTQPASRTYNYYASFNLGVTVAGSGPLTYQWKKDGVTLANATNSDLYFSNATPGNSGTYTVVVTNSAGSVTSAGAVITIAAAVAPTITTQPASRTYNYYASFDLGVTVAGSGPLTYQWKKDGVALANATGSALYFSSATPANSGTYTVVVTNSAGSVTSAGAVITIAAAVAPTIITAPLSQTKGYFETIYLSVQVSGSDPFTFQWKKDGIAISNATSSYLYIYSTTPANSGTYTVVVTNPAGSVTSAGAVVTVTGAIAPAVTTQPASQTINYFEPISLTAQVSGSSPLTYQWKKDGVILPNATSSYLSIYSATPANSGTYTIVVTNPAGSVTSTGATVVVRAPVIPVISTQPASVPIAIGLSTSLSVTVNATGTGQLTYQWLRNGLPISGATSGSYSFNSVNESAAGDYTVVITGAAGSVTSAVATLTVLPPAAPSVQSWPYSPSSVSLGSSVGFSVYNVGGTGPFIYQWAKEGVPIPGATTSALNFPSVAASDLATYTLTISNEGGVLTSPGLRLRLATSSTYSNNSNPDPWLDVGRVGDVLYFLATQPARIERYDLAGERWLATTLLSETLVPTAFAPAAEGIYVAYGRALVRRSLDLTTETTLLNATANVTRMFVFENYLYYNASGSVSYGTLNRTTLQPGPSTSLGLRGYADYQQIALVPSLRKGFGTSNPGSRSIGVFTIAADGTVSGNTESPYPYKMPVGTRVYVFPGDQMVTDDSGTVYRTSDFTYDGSFGEAFTDLGFLSDGTPVVLRGQQLIAIRADNFIETSHANLANPGLRVFTRGTTAYVFGPATSGTTFAVTKATAADFAPTTTPAPTTAPAGRYSVDDAFIGDDNIVHVFSRTLQSFVRWDPSAREFLTTLPLRSAPSAVFHQPGNHRALISYPDGMITAMPLQKTAATEQPLANIGHAVRAVVDLGEMFLVNITDAQSSGDDRLIFGASGGPQFILSNSYANGLGLAWQSVPRRLYSVFTYPAALQYETITAAGAFVPAATGTLSTPLAVTPPLRFNAAGSLAVSMNGRVFNSDLGLVGNLANGVTDAAWLSTDLYTLRTVNGAAQIQQWSRITYLQTGTLVIRGTPVRILPLSDTQLLVVTSVQGYLSFTIVNSDLTVSTDSSHPVTIATQPQSQTVAQSTSVTLSVSQSGTTTPATYAWSRNGTPILGAAGATLKLDNAQPANAGLYTGTVTTPSGNATSNVAIVGLSTANKVIGFGSEIGANITHPNGNIFDQVLINGAAETITADAGQVTRTSYIDLNNDIVQVEFAGAGTLSLVLDAASGPAAPLNYDQPTVTYMKGHAGIVIAGANETTNVSVFTIGRATAFDPTGAFNILLPIGATNNPANNGSSLFQNHPSTDYDGVADLAFIAISSTNGKFGGLRASNADCFATKGLTGIYAPGVAFTGPVFIGDINASDAATPVFIIGSSPDTRITGGDLAQANSQPVKVTGLTQLKFVAGSTSGGAALPAQTNKARLEQNGTDVTSQIVVNPGQ